MKPIQNRAARVSKRLMLPAPDVSNRLLTRAALLFAALILCGCISKTDLKLKQQQAFIAGQQSAMMTMQQNAHNVQVRGNVKNPTIPWTEGLTVSKAIIAAEYQGAHDPESIVVMRNGIGTEIKAADLLKGQDEPLQPGDLIEIR
jgi:hypothetical protein